MSKVVVKAYPDPIKIVYAKLGNVKQNITRFQFQLLKKDTKQPKLTRKTP